MTAIKIGTRASALALAQTGMIADRVRALTGREVELVEISTPGDRSSAPVRELGVGVFTSALRDALAAKEIDVAVHSYKDLPTTPYAPLGRPESDSSVRQLAGRTALPSPADHHPVLTIAAVPLREDPRDALVARDGMTLLDLPEGARIGTGALRRVSQINALGRGFECVPIRGNVDTRINRVLGESADLDAVVLARAGISRLGRLAVVTETLDPMFVLPAPAQGALAVECRTADTTLTAELAELDDRETRAAVSAERAMLATLEAGCSAPVAALCDIADAGDGEYELYLRGAVIQLDGRHAVRLSDTGTLTASDDADEVGAAVGRRLAATLLAEGAESLLESVR
ncbi:hydroxymethylbilane synthase [Phytomonospora endophytica]|uniref:Hydroxymethylbilane synthase n=1 Tax=Phytomonospora endophytica TaxID=714109 RepID=A0A841FNK7_9ACTN|nr:hydroxymethylbilane synthase [Phytomonospora endophytica]MBB6037655.1 hydroxymethylbilane synthase [Phytomonospora endophytica]GIG67820.1 porphobilinogen deaminase [Phytomonospora endophytica]